MELDPRHRRLLGPLLIANAVGLMLVGMCVQIASMHEENAFSCGNDVHLAFFGVMAPLVVALGVAWLGSVAWCIARGVLAGGAALMAPVLLFGMWQAGDTAVRYATYDPTEDPFAACDAEGRPWGRGPMRR